MYFKLNAFVNDGNKNSKSYTMRPAILLIAILFPGGLHSYAQTADNAEILSMYERDQSSRKIANINWAQLNKDDSLRRSRVNQLLDSNKVLTGKDFYRSAMIFQHGNDTIASAKAVSLMKKALDLDSTVNKWLLAAAIDRHLMRQGKPQIYGTQYIMMGQNGKWQRYQIDTTQVTDQERKIYNVETLSEQKEKERRMNLRPIAQYHATAKSLGETAALIKTEAKKGSASIYDVSEAAINSFGYQLISKPEEALIIFKLNTELYPNGFNTYDSYAECLAKLNRKDEAIAAYQKSIRLNPGNGNAKTALLKLQGQ